MLEEASVTELNETLIPTTPTLPTIAILPSLETQSRDTKKSDDWPEFGLRIRLMITQKGIFAVVF